MEFGILKVKWIMSWFGSRFNFCRVFFCFRIFALLCWVKALVEKKVMNGSSLFSQCIVKLKELRLWDHSHRCYVYGWCTGTFCLCHSLVILFVLTIISRLTGSWENNLCTLSLKGNVRWSIDIDYNNRHIIWLYKGLFQLWSWTDVSWCWRFFLIVNVILAIEMLALNLSLVK